MADTSAPKRFPWTPLILVILSCGALFKIWEQDIYWLIRDGDEMFATFRIPYGDQWSFSAEGGRWINTYWLSSLIFSAVNSIGGEFGLVLFRALLSFLLLNCMVVISRPFFKREHLWILFAVNVPLFFLAILPKIQLRPDLLTILIYAVLNFIWLQPGTLQKKIGISLGFLLLGVNLHQGASLALIGYFCFELCTSEARSRTKIFLSLLALALYFCTPNFIYTLDYIKTMGAIFDHSQQNVLENPDFLPFGWSSLSYANFGWSGLAVLLWMGIAWIGVFKEKSASSSRIAFLVLLCILGFFRERLLPFFLITSLPFVARFWAFPFFGFSLVQIKKAARLAAIVIWIALLPLQLLKDMTRMGFSPEETVFPIGSIEFIEKNHPLPNVYHSPTYGVFMIHHLRNYKVFIDTREVMYTEVHRRLAEAFHSEEKTTQLLEDFSINTVLMPTHMIMLKADGQYWDRIVELYPIEKWALVFFDRISMVLVRRIPEHRDLIANHEYIFLKPNLPPFISYEKTKTSSSARQQFWRESKRCMETNPSNWICIASAAEIAKERGESEILKNLIEQLIAVGESNGFNPFMRLSLEKLRQ